MWTKPHDKGGQPAPTKIPGKLLALLLVMPCMTVLLALIGQERIAQFMLMMTGPMVVLTPTICRRRAPSSAQSDADTQRP